MISKQLNRILLGPRTTHIRILTLSRNASADAKIQNPDKFSQLKELKQRPLYLDVQATTPMDPRVLDDMLPYMTNMYGNPHSRTHAYGWESEKAVEEAREVPKKIKKIFLNFFLASSHVDKCGSKRNYIHKWCY